MFGLQTLSLLKPAFTDVLRGNTTNILVGQPVTLAVCRGNPIELTGSEFGSLQKITNVSNKHLRCLQILLTRPPDVKTNEAVNKVQSEHRVRTHNNAVEIYEFP